MKSLVLNLRNTYKLLIGALLLLSLFLRVMYLSQGSLTFGYDQARDAFVTHQILNSDLKILGPPSSTPGLFHGVLYNYLLVIPYAFGMNPIFAAYWIALINSLAVIPVFYITYLITKKFGAALFAGFLFAISFESTQYANWLSNPTIAVLSVPVAYLGLWMMTKERSKWGAVLAGVFLGVSVQAEIFLLYHFVPFIVWMFINKRDIRIKQIFYLILFFVLSTITMIVSEAKFGFKGIEGALSLLSDQKAVTGSVGGLGDTLTLFLNQISRVYAFNVYPGNIALGGAFVLTLIFYSLYKAKGIGEWPVFLALWLFAHVTVVSVGGVSTPFLLVGIGPAVSIIVGIYLYKWWKKSILLALAILGIVVYSNLIMIRRENVKGQVIFAIQKDMLLSKEVSALDYMYLSANGESFSVKTVTSPFWVNTTWSYLFNWYGQEKYGYLPNWHGRDQVGRLGNNLSNGGDNIDKFYLILEPPAGIPARLYSDEIEAENAFTQVVEEKNFGELVVQRRARLD